MDSEKLFNKIRNEQIKFDDALINQEDFLKKLSEVKIGRKNHEQEEVIANLDKFDLSKKFLIFVETNLKYVCSAL